LTSSLHRLRTLRTAATGRGFDSLGGQSAFYRSPHVAGCQVCCQACGCDACDSQRAMVGRHFLGLERDFGGATKKTGKFWMGYRTGMSALGRSGVVQVNLSTRRASPTYMEWIKRDKVTLSRAGR
jgi:hypothetical protein